MDELAHRVQSFLVVEADRARAAIAAAILGIAATNTAQRSSSTSARLGTIDLHPHQTEAVDRLRVAMAEFGGALLCDPVGRGKTFIALALVRAGSTALVAAPSVLRPMWMQSAAAAERNIEFVSFETLSRGCVDHDSSELLIVDEAHHARNPATKRFASLSRLASRKDVLLLSATPIHNRQQDLCTVLSLFLGSRAARLTTAELGRCVVRRDGLGRAHPSLPRVEPLQWFTPGEHDDTVPKKLLSLPPPLPPADGGDGGVLIVHSLIRQWASSDAALRGGLMRRMHRSIALLSALEDGTYPSRRELAAWMGHDDTVQLAFSALVAGATREAAKLLPVVRSHRDALLDLLAILNKDHSRDRERLSIVRRIRDRHRGDKIVAFTQFSDTVDFLSSQLAADGGVGALTGSAARVAGGKLTRREAIGRFAPLASNRARPGEAEQITFLITTDLLSEGVNLQDASVVIHLDLPWTPARMDQRVGRIARLGSSHNTVFTYAVRPPACTESIIRIEQILRDKMHAAGIIVPPSASFVGGPVAIPEPGPTPPSLVESTRAIVSDWNPAAAAPGRTIVGAVHANVSGFLAACGMGGRVCIIASLYESLTDDPGVVLECARYASGADALLTPDEFIAPVARLDAWLEAARALEYPATSERGTAGQSVMRRIALIMSRALFHERGVLVALCDRARTSAGQARGVEAERRLADLMDTVTDDTTWLEHVIASGASPRAGDNRTTVTTDDTIIALLILRKRA